LIAASTLSHNPDKGRRLVPVARTQFAFHRTSHSSSVKDLAIEDEAVAVRNRRCSIGCDQLADKICEATVIVGWNKWGPVRKGRAHKIMLRVICEQGNGTTIKRLHCNNCDVRITGAGRTNHIGIFKSRMHVRSHSTLPKRIDINPVWPTNPPSSMRMLPVLNDRPADPRGLEISYCLF